MYAFIYKYMYVCRCVYIYTDVNPNFIYKGVNPNLFFFPTIYIYTNVHLCMQIYTHK